MQIFIAAPSRTFVVGLDPSDKVFSLKNNIFKKEGIPVEEQALVFGGRHLKNTCEIKEYDVHDASTLTLLLRLQGGAQLGKAVKGRSKDKNGNKLSDEEKHLLDKIKRMETNDQQKRMAMTAKIQLKEWMINEQKNSKLNSLKIQNQWRKIMRLAKVESLRKDIEVLSQNHERDVDRKDAIIQLMDRELEESEEQLQMIIRSHLLHVDSLIDLQDARLLALENEFEEELKVLKDEFQVEKDKIMSQHQLEKDELLDIMRAVEIDEKEREGEARQEYEQLREEIRNKNLEDINVLRITLDSNIEELEQQFETAHLNYLQNTDQRTQDFKYLIAKDHDLSKDVDIKIRKIERLQSSIGSWKAKIAQNGKDSAERNKALQEEKDSISSHFQKLKGKLNKFREQQSKRLAEIAKNASQCKKVLRANVELAEKILKLGELARKLETEQERILPFYTSTHGDTVSSLCGHSPNFSSNLDAPINNASVDTNKDDDVVQEWSTLDKFWKRYNKALLDKLTIQKEKEKLEKENRELQIVLKQYLDGISVNEDVMNRINPLLVVNNAITLNNKPMGSSDGRKKSIVEANHMVSTGRVIL